MTKSLREVVRQIAVALLISGPMLAPATSKAGVAVSITVAPPVLPVYAQPPCPAEGYLWMPGYWAWGPYGYYWVPGTWVLPPHAGVLWTPGYWGFTGGSYLWHEGYWGPHVGFYGGVHYGFGYTGVGFQGGYWNGGHFLYNTAVTRVNVVNVHNVYNKTVIVNNTYVNNTRVSYNGGAGTRARPTPEERAAMNAQRIPPTERQFTHAHTASMDRQQFVSANHGQPATFASPRPIGQNRTEFRNQPQAQPAPRPHQEYRQTRPPEHHAGDAHEHQHDPEKDHHDER